MIVIVSWYMDGSGEPSVRFRDIPGVHGADLELLIDDIRDIAQDKHCRVYDVGESVSVVYDSTAPQKERNK